MASDKPRIDINLGGTDPEFTEEMNSAVIQALLYDTLTRFEEVPPHLLLNALSSIMITVIMSFARDPESSMHDLIAITMSGLPEAIERVTKLESALAAMNTEGMTKQ